MFIIGNLLQAIAEIINLLLQLYSFIIIIAALVSWIHVDPYNPLVQMLYQLTEPILRPIRKHLPSIGGLDLSPIIVMLACSFLRSFLVNSLRDLAILLKMK